MAALRRSWVDRAGAGALLLTGALVAGCGASAPATGPAPAPPPVRTAAAPAVGHLRPAARFVFVDHPTTVHQAPGAGAPTLGRLSTRTQDGTDELVEVLASQGAWLRVRTALRGRQVGWIRRAAASAAVPVRTRLVVDRRKLTATLLRDGHRVLRVRVGIGTPATPTPAGRFYVRDKLTGLAAGGIYGPIAFGTSGRSDHVTDWPGGSFVGIHGTNAPQLLPGRVSHGCVRMRNRDIRRLARVMPVGTPVLIR